MQIPVFVISLLRAPQRRASIEAHLRSMGLDYEIVDAVDGALMPDLDRDRLLAPGVSYAAGVVGCYLSHIRVYEEVVKRSIPVALVLEDDARLNPALVRALREGAIARDYDFCLLDCDDVSEDIPVFYDPDTRKWLAPGFPIYEPSVGPALLHAYLITAMGARKRLEFAWPIRKPIDIYHHLPYRPDMRVCVQPKGAWVSEHSRQSFTSTRNDTSPLRFRFLRRFPLFFELRDLLKLRALKGRFTALRMTREGLLPSGRRWRPLPSGRNIIG